MRWLVIAALLPLQAVAQDAAVTVATCDRLKRALDGVGDFELTARRTYLDAGACAFDGVLFDFEDEQDPDFEVRRLRIALAGARAFLEEGVVPQGIDLTVEGLTPLMGVPGDPLWTYITSLNFRRMSNDIDLVSDWNAQTRTLEVSRFNLSLWEGSEISGTARVANVQWGTAAQIQGGLGGVQLEALSLSADNNGWFEQLVANIALVHLLEGSEQPEADMATLRRQWQDAVADLPGEIFIGDTRSALFQLAGDMPTPNGTVTMDLAADPGLGMLRFAPLALSGDDPTSDEIWGVLTGVTVDVTYDRVPF